MACHAGLTDTTRKVTRVINIFRIVAVERISRILEIMLNSEINNQKTMNNIK